MRRALVAALTAGVCSAALTGCTKDSAAGPTAVTSSGTSSGTPTTSEPTRSTPPTEPAPPVMPALAREQSKAGAKAFVRYYIKVLNYSIQAGTGKVVTKLSTPQCTSCLSVAKLANDLQQKGGYQTGGTWVPRTLYVIPLQPRSEPIVDVSIEVARGKFKLDANSQVRAIPREVIHNEFHLAASTKGWLMNELVST